MKKRVISFVLCLCILLTSVSAAGVSVFAASYDVNTLISLAEKYPDGKYWNHVGSAVNNPNGYTSVPCTHHSNGCSYERAGACECNWYNGAIQCMGYSLKLGEEIVGTNPRNWEKKTQLNAKDLRVGDIIRYFNDTHSIVVVGVKGNTIAYTGANWGGNCLIKWSTMDIDEVKNFSYVLHDESNNKTNTNIYFYKSANFQDKSETNNNSGEIWQMNDEGSLNVRSSANLTSSKVGTISAKSYYYVSSKYDDGTYLWGKVSDGIIEGWAALNYSSYISGVSETLKINDVESVFAGQNLTLRWSAVSGAEKYTVEIYKADGTLCKTLTSKQTSINLTLESAGIYLAVVSASNSKAPTWKMRSERKEITIIPGDASQVQSITLPTSCNIKVGEFQKLSASVLPKTAANCVFWKSSDESVASVLIDGTVLAHKSGSVYIYCTSLSNNNISAKCKVTVTVASVSGFKQNISKTTSDRISLSWNEVKGADGYRIYRVKSNGSYKFIADVKTLSCYDTSLKSAGTYRYNIKAYQTVNGKKLYGEFFGEICAVTAPAQVINLKATDISTKSFTLKWSKVSGADYYVIYRYNSDKRTYEAVKTVKGTSLKIKKKAGFSARYKVAAVVKHENIKLYGTKSSAVYGVTSPEKPALKASANKTSVTLSWNRVEGATGYIIYKKTQNGYKKIATVKSSSLKYTVKDLKGATNYTFKIKAYSKHGSTKAYSAYSSAVSITTKK